MARLQCKLAYFSFVRTQNGYFALLIAASGGFQQSSLELEWGKLICGLDGLDRLRTLYQDTSWLVHLYFECKLFLIL